MNMYAKAAKQGYKEAMQRLIELELKEDDFIDLPRFESDLYPDCPFQPRLKMLKNFNINCRKQVVKKMLGVKSILSPKLLHFFPFSLEIII